MARQIRLNAFQMFSPGHTWPGLWTHPNDKAANYNDIEFWVSLAKTAERGKFDTVFLADALGVYDVYGGTPDAALRTAAQTPLNDPTMLVPVMAYATKNLSFAVTSNLSYEAPYILARRFSTLDHLTKGRVAWNVVTGYLDSGSKGAGKGKLEKHDTRYDIADEYMQVMYKLWEGSWDDDAVVQDRTNRVFTLPDKVRRIRHEGAHFHLDAIHLSEPSPQRTPVLFQAGASSRGREFAARHAECIFVSGHSKSIVLDTVRDIRRLAAKFGRNPSEIVIFLATTVIVAATEAEAKDKYEEYREYVSPEGSLVLLSGWSGMDLSRYSLDDPIEYVKSNFIDSIAKRMATHTPGKVWRVRDLAQFGSVGGRGAFIVGSPTQVADELMSWVEEADVDGFNISRVVVPEGLSAFVDLVVPELQNRGMYKTDYAEGSFREKLFGTGHARLPTTHPAAQFRCA
jgi:FMN-dependent oxidoreductase (nitrilotriacetate monooxygenase family)